MTSRLRRVLVIGISIARQRHHLIFVDVASRVQLACSSFSGEHFAFVISTYSYLSAVAGSIRVARRAGK